jgi:hypothetical protein
MQKDLSRFRQRSEQELVIVMSCGFVCHLIHAQEISHSLDSPPPGLLWIPSQACQACQACQAVDQRPWPLGGILDRLGRRRCSVLFDTPSLWPVIGIRLRQFR